MLAGLAGVSLCNPRTSGFGAADQAHFCAHSLHAPCALPTLRVRAGGGVGGQARPAGTLRGAGGEPPKERCEFVHGTQAITGTRVAAATAGLPAVHPDDYESGLGRTGEPATYAPSNQFARPRHAGAEYIQIV